MSIYKACDIRGIYGKELCAPEVYRIGRALATMAPGRFLLGGDVRLSTPELKDALARGLLDSGAELIDLGIIPTPVLYFALSHSDASAGATVTASHNPPEHNGIKFMIGAEPVTRAQMEEVQALVARGDFAPGPGTLRRWDATREYLDFLAARFRAPRPLHVLVDAGCGAMGPVAPEAFRRAGYRVTERSCVPDGRFPDRSPNPADYSCLGPTGDALRACGADFGVAFDGDGDRVVFLDENGRPVQNEKALVLFVRRLLRDRPAPVVYDQKASGVVAQAVREMGGTPVPERSGHAFIKRRFLACHAALAGEVSGHFFFGETGYDDGLFAALEMASLLAEGSASTGLQEKKSAGDKKPPTEESAGGGAQKTGAETAPDAVLPAGSSVRPGAQGESRESAGDKDTLAGKPARLSELADAIVCPPITPDLRFPCPYGAQDGCLERAEAAARAAGAEISHLDGVRAEFADGWFLLRKSVTAEQMTLRVEARDEARLAELLSLATSALRSPPL